MNLVQELARQKELYARCPNCDEDFRLSAARLFDATKRLPDYAVSYLSEERTLLVQEKLELKRRKERAASRPRIAAKAVGIGKVVEKIAPSLPGFPVKSGDCRSLLEPIDYLVFRGLSSYGKIEAIYFVDVKSGGARLSETQKQVREVVERGRVGLVVTPRPLVERE